MIESLRSSVFILGLHRSGTTLLYQMLAASGCFNIITARHVICFDELRNGSVGRERSRSRSRERFARLGLSSRGVDIVDVGPDTPEEYGFILDNLHAGMSITRRCFHVFRSVCEVIQSDYGRDRPLLLKNPWDFGNGRLIKTLIPDARIVYIHRNPFHVLSSLYRVVVTATTRRHAYLSMLSDRYASLTESEFPWRAVQRLGAAKGGLIARGLIYQAGRSASGYLKSVRTSPVGGRIDVRYETLCRQPHETMTTILEFLGVNGEQVDYRAMIGAHTSQVVPEIARQRDLVLRKLSDYASAVGYDLSRLAVAF
ncbi:MAG: sulfotransferase [Phycisphaerales bacterium]|nr:MAG: sulfotransferase [Phycisphaerales bacterium]